jgi:hypothetical protein
MNVKLSQRTVDALQQIRAARNAYRSAAAAADGITYGKRAYNLRAAEKYLRRLLWEHRDELADIHPSFGIQKPEAAEAVPEPPKSSSPEPESGGPGQPHEAAQRARPAPPASAAPDCGAADADPTSTGD